EGLRGIEQAVIHTTALALLLAVIQVDLQIFQVAVANRRRRGDETLTGFRDDELRGLIVGQQQLRLIKDVKQDYIIAHGAQLLQSLDGPDLVIEQITDQYHQALAVEIGCQIRQRSHDIGSLACLQRSQAAQNAQQVRLTAKRRN